jgi:PAS domain S-box-containing protein
LGYKTKEMIGQHVLKFTHPDFRAATIEVIKHFNSGTKEMRFEAADITKDGRRIDIEDSIALIDYGGQKCGLIIVRDVSERKKMLAILEESSNRYRGLFETSRDAIMTLEPPSWYFTSGNSATLKMFKAKDEAEFLSYPPWKLSPKFQPDGQPSDKKAKEMIEYAMENGSNLFEWTHKRIGGEEFFAEVFLSKVKLGDDAFLQAIVRDITERKMSEEKIKNKTLDLERLNKVMIGRELKMVQLKKELERLKKEKI